MLKELFYRIFADPVETEQWVNGDLIEDEEKTIHGVIGEVREAATIDIYMKSGSTSYTHGVKRGAMDTPTVQRWQMEQLLGGDDQE